MYSLAQGLKKITSYVTKAKESRKRKFFLFSSLKAWDLFHLLGDPRLFMNLPKNYFSQSNFEDKQDLIRGLGETEIPLLEGTNKILHASGPRGKEKWPQRILDKTYLLVLEHLLKRHWLAGALGGDIVTGSSSAGRYVLASPLGCLIEPAVSRTGLPQDKELTRSPTHQQTIELKIYWAQPCPPEQDPVFPTVSPSHQEACKSLLSSSTRRQTEEARIQSCNLQKE